MARTKKVKTEPSAPVVIPQDKHELLTAWFNADAQLKQVKDQEFALRQSVVQAFQLDPNKFEGTETVELPAGYKLKIKKNMNYSLTNEAGQTVALQSYLGSTLQRPDLANGIVEWKPDFKKSIYKELLPLTNEDMRLKEFLAAALTVKPGAPSLEIVAPEPAKE